MNENSNIVPLRQPDEIDDPLTNILRSGARQLLAQAVEMEAEAFLAAMNGLKLPDGRDRLVRHGRRAGTCTCGRTASSCRLAWKTTANACRC
jgi:hypothetical protein